MELKLYYCKHCGNVVYKAVDSGVSVVCCGEEMAEIQPNTTDAAVEKHVPVIELNDHSARISVGSVIHPMLEEHYINMIATANASTVVFTALKPGEKPEVVVPYAGGTIEAYEHCNLHGFWKAKK